MGVLPQPKLPIIDLSKEDLQPGSSTWVSTCNQVLHALHEYGSFVAVYNKLPQEVHDTIFDKVVDLFDLPKEVKLKNIHDKPFRGYVGDHPKIPLYEGLGIDNANTFEGTQRFTNLMWPQGNEIFRENIHAYSVVVSELHKMVTRMIMEGYGLEKYHDSLSGMLTYLLRMMRYTKNPMGGTNVGLPFHTDKSFLTILHQKEAAAVEVQTKEGVWIRFQPSPSSFLVLAGDAFMAWSNGRIRSGVHRVIVEAEKPRYSVGVFALGLGMVETPEELVDDEHPLMFKPFNHVGLLEFYYSEEGRKIGRSLEVINAYCAVTCFPRQGMLMSIAQELFFNLSVRECVQRSGKLTRGAVFREAAAAAAVVEGGTGRGLQGWIAGAGRSIGVAGIAGSSELQGYTGPMGWPRVASGGWPELSPETCRRGRGWILLAGARWFVVRLVARRSWKR
ncbi:probable 2-oxoglutarate-dependent dioxygenase AOP1 [Malania oleifera]|uniref:probable 2-oxoglutarate-dependent dioxygenase AOP1 n=1 Tax=Malania oleifera TaxID=397392 RepID=UPI0025ADDDF9|nr:probable 2-oxoglutarate-dependent dioxygenase AOP1 [Malania oleifera]